MSDDLFINIESDEIEIGNTGFTTTDDGWLINKRTGHKRDPEGRLYDGEGELIFDPFEDEDYEYEDEEEYEWYS